MPLSPPSRSTSRSTVAAKVIVNAQAGAVLQAGEASFREAIQRAFEGHGVTTEVILARHENIAKSLRKALQSGVELVVLAGGDGTITHLLPDIVAGGRAIGILPLGTMNILGGDLGLTGAIDHDIAAIVARRPQRISLAKLNDTLFHSNSGLGILGMMAREREDARRRFPFSRIVSFIWAAARTLAMARPIDIEIENGGERITRRADAILVTNNCFEGLPWRRHRLDEKVLEVHVLEASTLAGRVAMVTSVLRGTWRANAALTSFTARRIVVHRPGRKRSSVATDGEFSRIAGALSYDVAEEVIEIFSHPDRSSPVSGA